jgi:hypothetical protein
MKPEFITYQKFDDVELANVLSEQLESHGIAYFVEEESLTFNVSFALNDPFAKEYAVKIKSEDFEKVNQLLKKDEENNVENVDKSYYLFSFTNDELMEVITKADEWSPFDFVLARKLLNDKGVIINEEVLSTIKEKRIEELKVPEASQPVWVMLGYIIALSGIALPFFMSAIGLFIGWHLSTHKKTLPDGERVYGYNETDRKHGKRIFYIGIVVFVLSLAAFIVFKIIGSKD